MFGLRHAMLDRTNDINQLYLVPGVTVAGGGGGGVKMKFHEYARKTGRDVSSLSN